VSKPVTLVTGAAGFIGSHLSRALLRAGHEVVALDDLSGGFQENLPPPKLTGSKDRSMILPL